MSLRFICPHCRVAVDPAAMEVSRSERAELRVCPYCDAPVVLAERGDAVAQAPDLSAGSLPSTQGIADRDVDQRDSSVAAA